MLLMMVNVVVFLCVVNSGVLSRMSRVNVCVYVCGESVLCVVSMV